MKSWFKWSAIAAFVFLWCYLAFIGLVKFPELEVFKEMATGKKTNADSNQVEWKTVDIYTKSIPEDVDKKNVDITTGNMKIEGINMFYRKAAPSNNAKSSGQSILLLHGRSFKSETWEKLGTMHLMAALGHLVLAVDLPGYGETHDKYNGDRSKFILSIVQSPLLSGNHPVLISPSMSGEYSVKFVGEHADMLSGYIPVAPVATSSVPQSTLKNVKVPTLIVTGENDETPMAKQAPDNLRILPNSQEIVLKDAGHAAYMDKPALFHKMLFNFMELLHQ